jgi:hypothetical protein
MFSIGIVAHTSRTQQAKTLADQTHAAFISFDNGDLGCDDNHEAVQHHLANLDTTWSVILEDDAQPVHDLHTQLRHALPMAPSPIVSLYLGQQRPTWAQAGILDAISYATTNTADWITSSHLLHAVGYAIKTPLLPSLLSFTTALPVDQHITCWARTYGYAISYTYPSLVDHLDQPTLFDHPDGQQRQPGRIAHKVGPHQHWTTRSVPMTI